MSTDPYASPNTEIDDQFERGSLNIGTCISRAWSMCWHNFPIWLAVGIVGFILFIAGYFIILVGWFLLWPALSWGTTKFILNMHDGKAEFNDLFSGFNCYGKATGRFGLLILFSIIAYLIIATPGIIGAFNFDHTLMNIGTAIQYLSILLFIRFYLTPFLIVDKDLSAMDALSQSWELTRGSYWKLILLYLLTLLFMFAGFLALIIGIFPAMCMTYIMWGSAYRQITKT